MKNRKINIYNFNFLLSIFLIQFATYTKNISFLSSYSSILINFSLIILFFHVMNVLFSIRISKKKWMMFILVLLVCVSSYYITKDSLLLQFYLIFLGALKIDFKNVMKKDLIFKLILFAFILLCDYYGYSEITRFIRNGEVRYSLGFIHPNTLGYFILITYFEIIYLFNNKIKLLTFIILSIFCELLLIIPQSRAAQLAIMIFTTISLIWLLSNKLKIKSINNTKKYSFVFKNLFLILLIISLIATFLYSKKNIFAIQLNSLFSNRLYLQSLYFDIYDISLFGHYIDYFSIIDNYFATLDNVYIRLILNFGVFGYFVMYLLFNKTIHYSIRVNDKLLVIILTVFLVYGLMEYNFIKPSLNIFLLYLPSLYNNQDKKLR